MNIGRGFLSAWGLLAALGLFGVVPAGSKAELVYGVTAQGNLITWDSGSPTNLLSGIALAGLQLNETLVGIDLRPANGQLYGIGSTSRLYNINPATGVASQVGMGQFAPLLDGNTFGMDFNPTVDRIRVVSNADQNLRIHPDSGSIAAVDTALAYGAGDPNFGVAPNVVGSAYTNNFAGALTTTLYGIDAGTDSLVIQNPPNAGTLSTVGLLGVDIIDVMGFDISGASGTAYAVLFDTQTSRSVFATINTTTGAASIVGEIDGGTTVTAMTVVPEPGTLALLGLASCALLRRRSIR